MKKISLILIILGFLTTPLFVFSAPSLAEKMKGKILLAVEDKGRTYYVHTDGNRYQITPATAQKIFEKLALGITNKNLEEIPLKDVGIEPEVKVAGCSGEVVEKIVYVDKPTLCDYSAYNSKINQLESDLASCKKLGSSQTTTDNSSAEDSLKKEYGLKINEVKTEIADIEYLQLNAQKITDFYKQGDYYSDGTNLKTNNSGYNSLMDTSSKLKLLTELFYKDIPAYILSESERLHRNIDISADAIKSILNNKNSLLQNQLNQLQNELERKLLEL